MPWRSVVRNELLTTCMTCSGPTPATIRLPSCRPPTRAPKPSLYVTRGGRLPRVARREQPGLRGRPPVAPRRTWAIAARRRGRGMCRPTVREAFRFALNGARFRARRRRWRPRGRHSRPEAIRGGHRVRRIEGARCFSFGPARSARRCSSTRPQSPLPADARRRHHVRAGRELRRQARLFEVARHVEDQIGRLARRPDVHEPVWPRLARAAQGDDPVGPVVADREVEGRGGRG